jgi:hypothetical protein
MSNDIKITISGNDAAMIAVWQRQNAQILKNQAALEKLAQAGEKAGKGLATGADAGLSSLTKFAGAISGIGSTIGGITAVVAVLKREYEDLIRRQKAAADIQISLADAQSQAIINLGKDDVVDRKKLLELTRQGSKDTGLSERDFTLAYSDALSARGDKSAMQAFGATKASAALLPFNPQAAKLLSGAVLDISKGGNISPEAAVGYFASVSRAARVTDFQGTAEHIAPGIVGVTKFGDNLRQAGGLLSTLSLGEADPTGRRSRTASISLAKQLEERFPDLANTEERIRAVQGGGPAAWKKFFEGGKYKVGGKSKKFEGASFEATALPTIRGLLSSDAGTQERKEYEASLKNVIDPATGEAVYKELMSDIGGLKSVQLARKQRLHKGQAESEQIDDLTGATQSVTREGIDETLSAMNEPWLLRKIEGYKAEARIARGENPDAVAASVYRGRATAIRTGENANRLTDQQQADAAKYDRLADGIERLIKLQEESNKIAEGIEKGAKKGNDIVPKAGPGTANQR